MKKFISLNYFKKLTFLLSAGVLFINMPSTFAQEKGAVFPQKETYRIKILKEKDGKFRMLDTTLTATDFEKFKTQPGEFQDLLKEVQPTRIRLDKLERIEKIDLPHLKEISPAKPLCEKEITTWRKVVSNHFSPDSGRHIIILNQSLRPTTISIDSLQKKIIEVREQINFKVSPSDSNKLHQIFIDKTIDGKPVKIYRLAPTSALTVDSLRFTDHFIISNKQTRIFAVHQVSIKDVEKQDKQILSKVTPPNETNLTEDLRINNLKYYPNPNNGKFTLSFKVPRAGDIAIKIYDQLGREIHREDYQYFSGDYQKEINMANAERGVYFLKIIQGDSAMTKKLVVD